MIIKLQSQKASGSFQFIFFCYVSRFPGPSPSVLLFHLIVLYKSSSNTSQLLSLLSLLVLSGRTDSATVQLTWRPFLSCQPTQVTPSRLYVIL